MKIAVLGATGQTGQCVVQQALEEGHQVVALVRSPEKMTIEHKGLQVLKSDVLSEESLEEGMKGCDAVISSLGGRIVHESSRCATAAMRDNKITRFIVTTGIANKASEGEPWYFKIGRYFCKEMPDWNQTEDYVQAECDDLKWTVVKPPCLKVKPFDPRPLLVEEVQLIKEGTHDVPHANVAKFMLEQLENTQWENKMVAIDLPKK